jgi:hypothetical protein
VRPSCACSRSSSLRRLGSARALNSTSVSWRSAMFYTQVITCLNDRQVTSCMSSAGKRSPAAPQIEATLGCSPSRHRLATYFPPMTIDGRLNHRPNIVRPRTPRMRGYRGYSAINRRSDHRTWADRSSTPCESPRPENVQCPASAPSAPRRTAAAIQFLGRPVPENRPCSTVTEVQGASRRLAELGRAVLLWSANHCPKAANAPKAMPDASAARLRDSISLARAACADPLSCVRRETVHC